jgi:pSer/pThr/pTyr-binding forkhead associated (FHA) protein
MRSPKSRARRAAERRWDARAMPLVQMPDPPTPRMPTPGMPDVSALLITKQDGTIVRRIGLDQRRKLTVGRSNRCDLTLSATAISRRHALLFEHAGAWHIVDTASRTGTFDGPRNVHHAILDRAVTIQVGPAFLSLEPTTGPVTTAHLGAPLLTPEDLGGDHLFGSNAPPEGPRLIVADADASSACSYAIDEYDLLTIGRAPSCDVILEDKHVSNLHAVLYTEQSGWCVADAGSTDGTRVHGLPTRRRRLADRTIVRVGRSMLWIEGEAEEQAEEIDRDWLTTMEEQDFDLDS